MVRIHHPSSAPAHATPHPVKRRPRRALGMAPTAGTGRYLAAPLPPGSTRRGPLRPADQGISAHERSHAETAIKRLFEAPGVDTVAYYDEPSNSYVLRSRTGLLRWERWMTPNGEPRYVVVEQTGDDVIPSVDGTVLRTFVQETSAAGGAGKPVPKAKNSYPDIFERLSQLWDTPRAPDFVYIPTPGADPNHPGAGSHGTPDIVQSRAPLVIAAPGLAGGTVSDALVRHADVAPTMAQLLGVRPVLGRNSVGALRPQLMKWQDGTSLTDALAGAGRGAHLTGAAQRAILFAVDGLSQTVLDDELKAGRLPNIARLVARGTTFRNGSLSQYPTVTWSNHNTLVTGAAPGHNGIANNSWFERTTQTEQLITDGGFKNSLRTGRLISPEVETLYEAVERSFPDALTVAINQPSGRGADMSVLDLKGVGNLLQRLPKVLGAVVGDVLGGTLGTDDMKLAGWKVAIQDVLAGAMGEAYWNSDNPPKLGVFEFTQVDNRGHILGPHSPEARAALHNVDRQIGQILTTLDRRGLTNSTAIVLTADHGMEHQETDTTKTGGWFESLKRAKADGVVTKESTRFVYVRSVRVGVEGSVPSARAGGALTLRVVNDDQDASGARPSIAGAVVTVTDASGRKYQGTTTADGRVQIVLPAGVRGPVRVVVEAAEFSRETLTVPLG